MHHQHLSLRFLSFSVTELSLLVNVILSLLVLFFHFLLLLCFYVSFSPWGSVISSAWISALNLLSLHLFNYWILSLFGIVKFLLFVSAPSSVNHITDLCLPDLSRSWGHSVVLNSSLHSQDSYIRELTLKWRLMIFSKVWWWCHHGHYFKMLFKQRHTVWKTDIYRAEMVHEYTLLVTLCVYIVQ